MAVEFECADIEDRLLSAIREAGLDPERVSPDQLGTLDHFHTGGRRATLELLDLAELRPEMRVLDIGAGIGGPARLIAATYGCRVDCLEPSADFRRGARLLNRMTGLDHLVTLHDGDALAMPFGDGVFDLAWMQNVGMCVADKAALYAEVARVLRSGGALVLQEPAAGPAGDPYFPVPWATDSTRSHLVSIARMTDLLEDAGLHAEVCEDASEVELNRPSAGAAPGPLTLAVYIDDVATKSRNSRRSLEDGRLRFARGVFRKP